MARTPSLYSKNKRSLPYSSEVGGPVIEVPDVGGFRSGAVVDAKHKLDTKFSEIKQQYEQLVELAQDTELVYNSAINFVPVVGKTYHLYYGPEGHFLSLIEPERWDRFEHLGSYQLESDKTWKRV